MVICLVCATAAMVFRHCAVLVRLWTESFDHAFADLLEKRYEQFKVFCSQCASKYCLFSLQ